MRTLKNTPLISIMMPAYNAENYIQESIDSILAQTYQNWELIIVNDGSTDQTEKIISEYIDPRIKKFTQKNQGEAVARNHALSKMNGKWVAFLDSDDLFEPEFLHLTLSFLEQNETFDAVYTDGRYIDSNGNLLEPLSKHRRGPFTGDIFEQVVRASDVFGPPTCTLLNLEKIQNHRLIFDSRIVIGPDWDFLTRFAEIGKFGYLDFYGVRYRVHQTNITVSTSSEKRRRSLAVCRENHIKNPRFTECSLDTQFYVFYDLLVNLIFDNPSFQNQITQSNSFQNLTRNQQAKLYRLMVTQAVVENIKNPFLKHWLILSLRFNKWDPKTLFISLLFFMNKKLLKFVLSKRQKKQKYLPQNSPFQLKP
ncbi:MAG: hypothetical protein CL609_20290 [Anaerolineaceae bacterium]|nr:hypothetical protein [Anaerolineaceae bacterium]